MRYEIRRAIAKLKAGARWCTAISEGFRRYHNCSVRDPGSRGHSGVKENHREDTDIDETATLIAAAIRKHVDRVQQRAKADLTEALAAADAERKTLAAQHREALTQLVDVRAQLKRSQQEVQLLAAERGELQHALDDAVAAKTHAEARYEELVAASQKLTEGLSRTLNDQREQARPAVTAVPKRSEPAPPVPPVPSPKTAKKPLQFPGPARDAKRVRIRQGTHISVDGIPGQLIDLSLGGAQAILTQMVKPNQLVRITAPTAAGQLICKGRVVWVVYEQPGTSMSVYRMGVKFTDIDAKVVEDFMKDFADQSAARRAMEIA